MSIIKDDRTEEQKKTHPLLVVGTDRGMSGFGGAEGLTSLAAWAVPNDCNSEKDCTDWVEGRCDMSRVRTVIAEGYRPKNAHLHIYVYKGQKRQFN